MLFLRTVKGPQHCLGGEGGENSKKADFVSHILQKIVYFLKKENEKDRTLPMHQNF